MNVKEFHRQYNYVVIQDVLCIILRYAIKTVVVMFAIFTIFACICSMIACKWTIPVCLPIIGAAVYGTIGTFRKQEKESKK